MESIFTNDDKVPVIYDADDSLSVHGRKLIDTAGIAVLIVVGVGLILVCCCCLWHWIMDNMAGEHRERRGSERRDRQEAGRNEL